MPTRPPGPKTIAEIAAADADLSTLVAALKAADLVDTLSGPGPFTVFAPTNAAFNRLPAGVVANLLKPENKAKLVDLLTYHVVTSDCEAPDCLKPQSGFKKVLQTACPLPWAKNVTISFGPENSPPHHSYFHINKGTKGIPAKESNNGVRFGPFAGKTIPASNGVIYIIEEVLIVPLPNIVALAVADPNLSTLVTALKAADLVDALLASGKKTVFAPTNTAFAALPAGVLANLLKPENKAQLVDLLTYHVAAGDVQSKDLTDMEMITTVEGKNVTARVSSDGIFINSAKVTAADNEASNGVVHIIDSGKAARVLTPRWSTAPSVDQLVPGLLVHPRERVHPV